MVLQVSEDTRVGDVGREKWTEFLSKCFQMGLLDADEFTRRMETVQSAKMMEEIRTYAIHDLPSGPWNYAWDKQREKGLRPKAVVLPDVLPKRESLPRGQLVIAIWVWMLLAIAGWSAFFTLIEARR